MPEYKNWLLTEQTHIATLTLNRAEKMNSLNAATLYELRDISAHLRDRPDIWVLVVQGQGDHFSSGMDLDVIKGQLDQPEGANREFLLGLQRCLDAFEALEKPTIAKLRGFCVGGGLILALCCDFRVASLRTVFSLPEVPLGLPIIMGTQRVTRAVGPALAKEMILLGKRFRAKAALECGLVHQLVPPDQLDQAVTAMAGKFLKLPPRTVGIAKRLIDAGDHLSLRQSQDLELDALAELLDSPDVREAMDCYSSKRQPQFRGE